MEFSVQISGLDTSIIIIIGNTHGCKYHQYHKESILHREEGPSETNSDTSSLLLWCPPDYKSKPFSILYVKKQMLNTSGRHYCIYT